VRTWASVRPVEPPDPAMSFADRAQAGSAAEASAALYWGRPNAVAKRRIYKRDTEEDVFLLRAYAWRDFSILSLLSATSGTACT